MGFHCSLAAVVALAIAACNNHSPKDGEADAGVPDGTPCEGLHCAVVDCAAKGLPPTSVSGTVFAPNGTLPLYGVTVYVPASDPGPLVAGVTCGNCAASLPGGSITEVKTDEAGHFTLPNVPATSDVPLVIQVGKWRRQIELPAVAACQDTPLSPVETTLPRTQAEGDIPQIAITTGNADALECLVRKLGIADSEFTTDAGTGRIHLFNGNGANQFVAGFPGGSGAFPLAETLWSTTAKLSNYDIAIFSCEGGQLPARKPQTSMQALYDYASAGGRIFLSHWQNIWIGGENGNRSHGIPSWQSIGTWAYGAAQDQENTIASVDETVPKGMSFATWLTNVGASTTRGQIPISGARYTLAANDPLRSDRRVYLEPALSNNHVSVQDLEFSTPNDVPPEQRCGKVVFSDMHVSSGSRSRASVGFPMDCNTGDLTPQEKALAFLLFDISSCVGVIQ
ncbi:MAG: carboxypeptidase-like regulatory domain-containing protein [Kofleriaceae bacterium]